MWGWTDMIINLIPIKDIKKKWKDWRKKRNVQIEQIKTTEDNPFYAYPNLVYLDKYKITIPYILRSKFRKGVFIDLSHRVDLPFDEVEVRINDELVSFQKKSLHWANHKFDILRILDICEEHDYDEFMGKSFTLELRYIVPASHDYLKRRGLLEINENEQFTDRCEIQFKNNNKITFRGLYYEKRLSLVAVKKVELVQVNSVPDIPFSISMEKRNIRNENECLLFWKKMKSKGIEAGFSEITCSFQINLEKNERKSVIIYFLKKRG